MDSDATDVVGVGLKHMDPLQGVVVEHTDLHVILCKEGGKRSILMEYKLLIDLMYKNTQKIIIRG